MPGCEGDTSFLPGEEVVDVVALCVESRGGTWPLFRPDSGTGCGAPPLLEPLIPDGLDPKGVRAGTVLPEVGAGFVVRGVT